MLPQLLLKVLQGFSVGSEERQGQGVYRRVFAESATPFERLSTLFIGALRLARQGRSAVLEGNRALASQRAERVSALARRLDVCLDHPTAPELCQNLSRLYQHIVARLAMDDIPIDPTGFDEVIAILEKLWQGFVEAEQREQT